MPASELIHSRMLRSLRRHFTSRANVQNAITTQDTHNEDITEWINDPLLMQLPCYIEPARGGEIQTPGNVLVTNQWNCIIAGYYPNISVQQQIVVDSIVYNVKDVSTESTNSITALVLEKVSL